MVMPPSQRSVCAATARLASEHPAGTCAVAVSIESRDPTRINTKRIDVFMTAPPVTQPERRAPAYRKTRGPVAMDLVRSTRGLRSHAFALARFAFVLVLVLALVLVSALVLALPSPSRSSASRTRANSPSEALSARGNFRSSASRAETMVDPITTRANHLWSAGTTYHGATPVEVWRTMSW